MKIIANYTRNLIDDKGNIEITFTVDNWAFKRNVNDLTKQPYSLEIKAPKSKRSIQQNKYFWRIIDILERELNIDGLDIYAYLIEKTNAEYDDIVAKEDPKVIERMRMVHRAVRVIRPAEHKGFVIVRVYYGSSRFNTKQMSQLIELVKDYAVNSGVEIDYYEDY